MLCAHFDGGTTYDSSKYVEKLKNEPNERADIPATFVKVRYLVSHPTHYRIKKASQMFQGEYTTIGTE